MSVVLLPRRVAERLYDLLEQMLDVDPEQRAAFVKAYSEGVASDFELEIVCLHSTKPLFALLKGDPPTVHVKATQVGAWSEDSGLLSDADLEIEVLLADALEERIPSGKRSRKSPLAG
jgi:hypothetical protein